MIFFIFNFKLYQCNQLKEKKVDRFYRNATCVHNTCVG